MNLVELFIKPIMPILSKAIDVDIDKKGLAELTLYVLGNKDNDSMTADKVDKCIVGGKIVEAIDGAIVATYIGKLRDWAENTLKA